MTATPREGLIDTIQAAARIGVAPITMRLWRWRRNPHQPPFVRVGARSIRYESAALDEWLASRTHKPSRKPGEKSRSPDRQRRRPGPR